MVQEGDVNFLREKFDDHESSCGHYHKIQSKSQVQVIIKGSVGEIQRL
jgi:hypothetical protein